MSDPTKEKDSQRENVRVVCRIRPISVAEKAKSKECVQLTNNSIQVTSTDTSSGVFVFDRVFGMTSTQVFYNIVSKVVNCSVTI